jgi:hypothetical protein
VSAGSRRFLQDFGFRITRSTDAPITRSCVPLPPMPQLGLQRIYAIQSRRPISNPSHPCSSVRVFDFPITCDFGDTRALRATALCLRSSARDPPGVRLLLQTKAKVPFNRAVTELSNRFFPVFQGSNPAQFQPCLTGFQCPVGRGSQRRHVPRPSTKYQTTVLAECRLLNADC